MRPRFLNGRRRCYAIFTGTTGVRRSHQRFASESTMVPGTIRYLRKGRGKKHEDGQQREVTMPGQAKRKLKFRQFVNSRRLCFRSLLRVFTATI